MPNLNTSDPAVKKVLMIYRVPCDVRYRISGSWDCWKPEIPGNTMDIYVPTKTGKGGILIRAENGAFLLASSSDVEAITARKDLLNILISCLNVAKKYNIRVAGIQCSRYFSFSTNVKGGEVYPLNAAVETKEMLHEFGVGSFQRTHPMINHAATCIAYTTQSKRVILDESNLSKSAMMSLNKDRRKLRVFCEEDEHLGESQIEDTHKDDFGVLRRQPTQPIFRDTCI